MFLIFQRDSDGLPVIYLRDVDHNLLVKRESYTDEYGNLQPYDFGDCGSFVFCNVDIEPVNVMLADAHTLMLDAGSRTLTFHLGTETKTLQSGKSVTVMDIEPDQCIPLSGSIELVSVT